jgi:DsbC/DsbD-like thiol-disulfide interchange protein
MITRRALGFGLALLSVGPARAGDASPWLRGPQSSVRLVAGGLSEGVRRAGVEIELKSGWKTYWRYPGDAGVPPRFDWSRSDNLAEARVDWPAPRAFETEGLVSIGYTDRVLFPVHVKAKDAARPVHLRLTLDYAVCEKLCVPAFAEVDLIVSAAGGGHDAPIRAALERVPRRDGDPRLALRSVAIDRSATPARVVVEVAGDPALGPVSAFVEGPSSDWALPVPQVEPAGPGLSRLAFTLDGAPNATATRGARLTLTLSAGPLAVETTLTLD